MNSSLYWTGRFLVKGRIQPKVTLEMSENDNSFAKTALRLEGGNIFVYDENGTMAIGKVLFSSTGKTHASILSSSETHPKYSWGTPVRNLVVASSLPSNYYLQKLSDFGVRYFQPIESTHSGPSPKEDTIREWNQMITDWAKLTKREPMKIGNPVTIEEFTKSESLSQYHRKLYVKYGPKLVLPAPIQKLPSKEGTLLIMPPEKGFTENEAKMFENANIKPFLQRDKPLSLDFKSLLNTAMVSELYHPNETWSLFETLKSFSKSNVK